MGVFRITNTKSNKVYIGFGTDLPAILNRHKAELKFGTHRNREMQTAWKSLGESAFVTEVLGCLEQNEEQQTQPAEELFVLLEMWVAKLKNEHYSVATL